MKQDKVVFYLHGLGYALILMVIAGGFIVARHGQEAFMNYLREDGVVENLTTLFLLATSIVAIHSAVKAYRAGKRLWVLMWAVLGFLFFFAAGEEISWGQRIFNVESSGFFLEKNLQKETNLHNLVVGNVKVNKLIFSQLLTVVLGFYMILLRPLAQKNGFFSKLVSLFNIPLPRWHHIAAMLVSILLISFYNLIKAGEVREFAFAVVFLLIFLYPAKVELHPVKPGREGV